MLLDARRFFSMHFLMGYGQGEACASCVGRPTVTVAFTRCSALARVAGRASWSSLSSGQSAIVAERRPSLTRSLAPLCPTITSSS